MANDADTEAQGEAPSFINPGDTGVSVYYLTIPGSGLFPARLSVPIGINAGPPDPRLSTLPGVTTSQYFKGQPAPPLLPAPPPSIDKELELVGRHLARWSSKWASLDMSGYLLP